MTLGDGFPRIGICFVRPTYVKREGLMVSEFKPRGSLDCPLSPSLSGLCGMINLELRGEEETSCSDVPFRQPPWPL